ncbi:UreD-domain-containing protein [Ganoderma leucocontextum]|nr:UreD-domain-containing protein [Ganoderma leucocontextum]
MTPTKIEQGHGRVVLHNDGSGNVFSELAATYPLKLLAPRLPSRNLSIVYMLSYGGGLVGGDHIRLDVEVHDAACLAILSQGSTKVFKTRPNQRLSANNQIYPITAQSLNVRVASASALFLLPDPVTCFRDAKYHQMQTFHLSKNSSAVLLDWVTSGRKSLGEEWVFSRYYSLNEVFVDDHRVAKDAMLLEERGPDASPLTHRSLADSLAPYSCYATVIIYGSLVRDVTRHLSEAYRSITVFKQHAPPSLLWSFSPICAGEGCIVRVAARETEDVKHWLGEALRDLQKTLGIDVYRRAFS